MVRRVPARPGRNVLSGHGRVDISLFRRRLQATIPAKRATRAMRYATHAECVLHAQMRSIWLMSAMPAYSACAGRPQLYPRAVPVLISRDSTTLGLVDRVLQPKLVILAAAHVALHKPEACSCLLRIGVDVGHRLVAPVVEPVQLRSQLLLFSHAHVDAVQRLPQLRDARESLTVLDSRAVIALALDPEACSCLFHALEPAQGRLVLADGLAVLLLQAALHGFICFVPKKVIVWGGAVTEAPQRYWRLTSAASSDAP